MGTCVCCMFSRSTGGDVLTAFANGFREQALDFSLLAKLLLLIDVILVTCTCKCQLLTWPTTKLCFMRFLSDKQFLLSGDFNSRDLSLKAPTQNLLPPNMDGNAEFKTTKCLCSFNLIFTSTELKISGAHDLSPLNLEDVHHSAPHSIHEQIFKITYNW